MKRNRLRHLPFLLTVAAFVGWFLMLAPTVVGGPATYVWVSGTSMEPTLMNGDFVILRRAETYAPGDVVAFRVPEGEPGAGAFIIHRIIGGSAADGFVMQGDNKAQADRWHPTAPDILGAQWLAVSGAGKYVTWLRAPAVMGSIAAGLVVFTIMAAGGNGRRKSPAGRSVTSTLVQRLLPNRLTAASPQHQQDGD